MSTRPVSGEGISITVPDGCEARIAGKPGGGADGGRGAAIAAAAPRRAVAHVSTAALPAERGDFGGGVVEGLRRNDVFVALVELEPEQVGSALVAREGAPDRLRLADFAPNRMQRTIHGQSGAQVFFSEGGRAFCLYAVLGSHAHRHDLIHVVNRIVAGLSIAAR